VHEVRFVDEQDGKRALAGEVFDVLADRVKHVASRRPVRDAERVADVTIEVTSPKRDVVAVGEAHGLVGAECVTEGAQDTGFSDARLSGHDGVFSLMYAGDELVYEATLAVREPELVVIDFLGKRLTS
jgi:hypothetical protein